MVLLCVEQCESAEARQVVAELVLQVTDDLQGLWYSAAAVVVAAAVDVVAPDDRDSAEHSRLNQMLAHLDNWLKYCDAVPLIFGLVETSLCDDACHLQQLDLAVVALAAQLVELVQIVPAAEFPSYRCAKLREVDLNSALQPWCWSDQHGGQQQWMHELYPAAARPEENPEDRVHWHLDFEPRALWVTADWVLQRSHPAQVPTAWLQEALPRV